MFMFANVASTFLHAGVYHMGLGRSAVQGKGKHLGRMGCWLWRLAAAKT